MDRGIYPGVPGFGVALAFMPYTKRKGKDDSCTCTEEIVDINIIAKWCWWQVLFFVLSSMSASTLLERIRRGVR